MTFEEFKKGIIILQNAFEGNYKTETLNFIFERVNGRTGKDWLRVCEALIQNQETTRLPAAWKILRTFPPVAEIAVNDFAPRDFYWYYLNETNAQYEKVVNKPFDDFAIICAGNKAIAALYFGKAYWLAMGIKKYDNHYDKTITQLEKQPNAIATDLAPF